MKFRYYTIPKGVLPGIGFCALLPISEVGLTDTLNTTSEHSIDGVAAGPSSLIQLEPVMRVPREQFGQVPEGQFVDAHGNLTDLAVASLFFPGLDGMEREAIEVGTAFFTIPHTAAEGLGPVNNQVNCLGCHLNSSGTPPEGALVTNDTQVSRASRTIPTNFTFTATGLDFDFNTGGRAADNTDAINDTGSTASFTRFGDFSPSEGFKPLEVQVAGDPVQHTRPLLPACLPDPISPVSMDPLLEGALIPLRTTLTRRRIAGARYPEAIA